MGQPSTANTEWRWAQDAASRSWIENPHTDLSDPDSWLDTNICWRVLLYNSGDKDETDGYRLEYSINAGVDWTAVTTSSSYVRSYDSPNFTDGDGTSQEIGSGTFDEGYWDDDGSIASYTLAQAQESEHEFCFRFLSADCPGETVLVRIAFDDGTDLDGYTYSNPSSTFSPLPEVSVSENLGLSDTPTVKMADLAVSVSESLTLADAAPNAEISYTPGYEITTDAEAPSSLGIPNLGPVAVGGDLYVFLRGSTNNNELRCYKSSDDGENWSEQDSSNRPDMNDGTARGNIYNISIYPGLGQPLRGDLIYVVTFTGDYCVLFHTFDTSSDTWSTIDKFLTDYTDTGSEVGSAIALGDTTNDILITCSSEVHGTNEDADYWYSTDGGSSWNGPYAFDDGSDSYDNLSWWCLRGPVSGDVYGAWARDDTGDAYIRWATDVDQTFGSHNDFCDSAAHATNDANYVSRGAVYENSSSQDEVCAVYLVATTYYPRSSYIVNQGTPAASTQITANAVHLGGGSNHVAAMALGVWNTTVYFVYSRGSDQDIYIVENEANGGWAGETEVADAVTADVISVGDAYVNGSGETVIPIMWGEGSSYPADSMRYIGYVVQEAGVIASDTVNVTESISASVSTPDISKSETVNVTESASADIPLGLSVNDSVNVTESCDAEINVSTSKSDSINVTESCDATISDPQIVVQDTVSVGEYIDAEVITGAPLEIDVQDTISIAENKASYIGLEFLTSDGISVSESVESALQDLEISKSDSITVSEGKDAKVTSLVSTSDSVSVQDLPRYYADLIVVAENINISIEAPTGALSVNVDDTINTAESVDAEMAIDASTSDQVTVGESAVSEIGIDFAASDSVSIDESVSTAIPGPQITVQDTITIGESTDSEIAIAITVQDTINVTENVVSVIGINVDVSDTINAAENLNSYIGLALSVSETINVTENIDAEVGEAGIVQVSVSDGVTISENLESEIGIGAVVQDAITVSESTDADLVVEIQGQDSVSVNESDGITISLPAHVQGAITISESIVVALSDLELGVSDSITVSESVDVNVLGVGIIAITVSDNINVSDSPILDIVPKISTSDGITVNENVEVSLGEVGIIEIDVSDSISVTEATAEYISISVGASDTINVSDGPVTSIALLIIRSETISISENMVQYIPISAISSDSVGISENINNNLPIAITGSDTISVVDSSNIINILNASVQDAIGVAESITLESIALLVSAVSTVSVSEWTMISGLVSMMLDVDLMDELLNIVTIEDVLVGRVAINDILVSDIDLDDVSRD